MPRTRSIVRSTVAGLLISTIIIAWLAPSTLVTTQSHTTSEHTVAAAAPRSVSDLPLAVDGAKTPELIPDALAYRHFIMAIAAHQAPTADELLRRNSLLARLGLSEHDSKSLVTAVEGVAEELDRLLEARQQALAASGDAPHMPDFTSQEGILLDITRSSIAASLSVDGVTQLDSFIRDHIKKCIKIYGEIPQLPQ